MKGMKFIMKKIFSIFMVFVITISLASNVLAYELPSELPSDWAKEEVLEAIYLNIVPEELQSKYIKEITRAEFAKVAIFYCSAAQNLDLITFLNTYEKADGFLGKDSILDEPFTDTNDFYVKCAYELGIVKGRSNGIFDPNSSITRQEAAVMLLNTYISMGGSVDSKEKNSTTNQIISDVDKIEEWARAAVDFMYQIDVMNGTSYDTFSPQECYTREQCYATFLRLYKNSPSKKLLWTYEEARDFILDDKSSNFILNFEFNNEKYSIYHKIQTGVPHGPYDSLWIAYRSGGIREITQLLQSNSPFRSDIYLYDFEISEDESTLSFKRDFNDKTYYYSVDIMTGRLTEN